MVFNIHQQVLDSESDEYLEKVGCQYREQLIELFEASVEAQTLENEGIQPGWADMMVAFGLDYLQVTPAQMSAADLREILFELFPRKVSTNAEEAPETIRELQLFWTFLQREFHLENAAACLDVVNDKHAVRRLEEELDNPANFGMAKSLVMMGMQRGFDMSTEEGMNKWVATYNAEISTGTGSPVPLPGMPGMPGMSEASRQRSAGSRKTQASKAKRKMAKSSRKQNRTKK